VLTADARLDPGQPLELRHPFLETADGDDEMVELRQRC